MPTEIVSEGGFLYECLENMGLRLRLNRLRKINILESLKSHLKLRKGYLNNVETQSRVLVLVLASPTLLCSSRSKYLLSNLSPLCVCPCVHTILAIKNQQRNSNKTQHLWCKLDIKKDYHIAFLFGNMCAKYVVRCTNRSSFSQPKLCQSSAKQKVLKEFQFEVAAWGGNWSRFAVVTIAQLFLEPFLLLR